MKRNKLLTLIIILAGICTSCGKTISPEKQLAERIMNDTLMNKVEEMALEIVKGGFTAGDSYGEVWIRDYNTFIELAMEVMPDKQVQDNLLTFFRFQGNTGDIVDGFIGIDRAQISTIGYKYRFSDLEPRFAAHKNTVETDQESSLIQAIWRYVTKSGNRDFLKQTIDGKTVLERMEWAMEFLLNERYDEKYGLLWGATTSDWGDVQPEHIWGVELDENSHLCIDIYDNAFFIVAINHFLELTDNPDAKKRWTSVRDRIYNNVRTHLWDSKRQKFIPHIYLAGSLSLMTSTKMQFTIMAVLPLLSKLVYYPAMKLRLQTKQWLPM